MKIRGMSGAYSGAEFIVQDSLVFGRNPQGCNVLFPDEVKGISRTHCKIDVAGNGATITDMGSSFGTFLNGKKITPYTPMPLNNGDTFYLGDSRNMFVFMGQSGPEAPAVAPVPAHNSQAVTGNSNPQSTTNVYVEKKGSGCLTGCLITVVIIVALLVIGGIIISNTISETFTVQHFLGL